jgi:hypothetical protein
MAFCDALFEAALGGQVLRIVVVGIYAAGVELNGAP